jgi:integrase
MSDKPPKPPKRLFKNDKWNETFHHFVASIANTTTRYQYDKTLRRFFAFITEKYKQERTPDKIVQADIEAFLQQPVQTTGPRQGKPISPSSHNAYCNALRAFYGYCGRDLTEFRGKMVPVLRSPNPTKHLKLMKPGEVDRDMTEEEVKSFFAAIPRDTVIGRRDFALFFAAISTGRRRFELTNLLRGDLERTTFTEDGCKRTGWRYWFRAKWRVTRESAEMPLVVIEAIRRFHTSAGLDFDTMPPETPLFFGVTGPADRTKPLNLADVDRRFRKYARAAGIGDNIVLHSLRWENTWQRLQATGNNWDKVMEEMGWHSIELVARYARRRRRKEAGDPTASKVAAKFAGL